MNPLHKPTVLVVDDDSSVTTSMALLLKQNGYLSLAAKSPPEALTLLSQHRVDLVIQDMNFSRETNGEEGMQLLAAIKNKHSDIPVLLITAWGSIELAVKGIRQGARDFITKPWDNQRLLQTIATNLSLSSESKDTYLSRQELDNTYDFSSIIGEHPALLKVLTTLARVSKTDAPILILGESGTGKELIADMIHRNSARSQQAHVKVNLGGINTALFDSEMFGHVKGAFTDAKNHRKGRFEIANNGSIFLDEIGDLDKASQVKLLRVLQDQSYQPVGSSTTKRADVRVISATHCDLQAMVEAATFREDLFYRLNLITLRLPPLRERQSDIHLLVQAHLKRTSQMYHLPPLSIEEEAMHWLSRQPWPGNIRQLQQSIERAVLMSGCSHLHLTHLNPSDGKNARLENDATQSLQHLTLDEAEKLMIENALKTHNHNITKVASSLGISRGALYRRLEKYGLV